MADHFTSEPMLEMYLFETTHLAEQLEQVILASEKAGFSQDAINEVFRIMHTIKGSSAMMLFDNISTLAHAMEDVFYFLRETKQEPLDSPRLADIVFSGVDFIKKELEKITGGQEADSDVNEFVVRIQCYLGELKQQYPDASSAPPKPETEQKYYVGPQKAMQGRQSYSATVFFEEGCQMENIRAYTVISGLKEFAESIEHSPQDIIENDDTAEVIAQSGFVVAFSTAKKKEEVEAYFAKTILLRRFELVEMAEDSFKSTRPESGEQLKPSSLPAKEEKEHSVQQGLVSVHVTKLDRLMDIMGELVIAEAMVTQNPELQGLVLSGFQKASRQLGKIIGEMQDTVMAIRMVPLATTFIKMQRVVRDMCKKLDKEVELDLVGEATEVDKNIIERISDPLMHLIRNAIDHGIEPSAERLTKGKPAIGKITLEAKNAGSDVLIIIRDDGCGLDKVKILARAFENGLVTNEDREFTDKEVYSYIFLPGFSTKEKVTEFSGRGVGMDVVTQNINSIGGTVLVDSLPGQGTVITLKIPLTLAIVDGMTIRVGAARYTLPIAAIRESFRPKLCDMITDPDGNEMIMVRGNCYPVLRLHRLFSVSEAVTDFSEGIMIMVESDTNAFCLFSDALIGKQQVVVKALPSYIKSLKQVRGLAGCTLLGDGSISLILDVGGMLQGYPPAS